MEETSLSDDYTCYTIQQLSANLTDKINGKWAIIVFP